VQAFNHLDKADTFPVDATTADVQVGEFAGIVLPGGVANPDRLRTDDAAVRLLNDAAAHKIPVAAICHAPWTLVEAGVLTGRTLTSWPSLQTDIRNAGATWRDEPVITDDADDWTLVSSRKPDDLDAFNQALVEAFGDKH
jgi:protease I